MEVSTGLRAHEGCRGLASEASRQTGSADVPPISLERTFTFLDSSPVACLDYVIECVPKDADAKCMHCQDHLGTDAVFAKTCIPNDGTATDVGAMCLVHRSCFDEFVRCSGVNNGGGWRKVFGGLYLCVCVRLSLR